MVLALVKYDENYFSSNWLSWAQGISALVFLSQMVLAICQAMDASYYTRNLWTITVTYTVIHAVFTVIMQTGAMFAYYFNRYSRMSATHNGAIAIAYFISLIDFILIIAFQYNWLRTYTPTWMTDVIDISSANLGEVRTYFNLQNVVVFLSFVAFIALFMAVMCHLNPTSKTTVKNDKK